MSFLTRIKLMCYSGCPSQPLPPTLPQHRVKRVTIIHEWLCHTLLKKEACGSAIESACDVCRLLTTLWIVGPLELVSTWDSLIVTQLKHVGIGPFIKGYLSKCTLARKKEQTVK